MDEFDIVKVRTRTAENAEFMAGGRVYIIDAKKGVKVPRNYANLAIEQNALRWNRENGGVTESAVYIEDDEVEVPKPITKEEIKALKRTGGMGTKTLIDGKPVAMKTIELDVVNE